MLGLRHGQEDGQPGQPSVYHLFYADEKGGPGTDLTFFEYPDAAPAGRETDRSTGSSGGSGRPMRSSSGPGGWASEGFDSERVDDRLRFRDLEGLEHELPVDPAATRR